MTEFAVSLWIPLESNELLFNCLVPGKYSDLRIILGKFNFSSKCIKKDATCFRSVTVSLETLCHWCESPSFTHVNRGLGLVLEAGIPLPQSVVHLAPVNMPFPLPSQASFGY